MALCVSVFRRLISCRKGLSAESVFHTFGVAMSRSPRFAFLLVLAVCAGCTTPLGESTRNIVLLICPASADQKRVAEQNLHQYRAHHHHHPVSRYIAVDTSRPNQKQTAAYMKKVAEEKQKADAKKEKLSDRWVDPAKLHCVMVFDTVYQEFVGSGCYVVGGVPAQGETDSFEGHNAEYIGSGKSD
jgi:hypothetical protein